MRERHRRSEKPIYSTAIVYTAQGTPKRHERFRGPRREVAPPSDLDDEKTFDTLFYVVVW